MRALFGVLALALGLLAAAEWVFWPVHAPEGHEVVGAGSDREEAEVGRSEADFRLPPLTTFSVLTTRPLFVEGRRPPPDEEPLPDVPVAQVDVPKQDPLQMNLSAILIDGKERIALLRETKKDVSNRLRQGDDFMGWKVEKIEADRVVMARGSEKEEIMLRQFKELPAAKGGGGAPPGLPPAAAEDVRMKIEEARKRTEELRRSHRQRSRRAAGPGG